MNTINLINKTESAFSNAYSQSSFVNQKKKYLRDDFISHSIFGICLR